MHDESRGLVVENACGEARVVDLWLPPICKGYTGLEALKGHASEA